MAIPEHIDFIFEFFVIAGSSGGMRNYPKRNIKRWLKLLTIIDLFTIFITVIINSRSNPDGEYGVDRHIELNKQKEPFMKKIKWGFIGCGDVTEVKSGPAFSKVTDSSVVIVMRRNGDKARDYAERHKISEWTNNADDVIKHPDVNAIYIATPPDSHAEYTTKAALAGKAVYVEKPMARNYTECRKMISVCKSAGVPLFVAYYRRTLPLFLKVKELVDNGVIGKILFVNVRLFMCPAQDDLNPENLPWRVLPEISGGGYFIDMGSHQLDYLDYLFGRIVSVKGIAQNLSGLYPAEDTVSASFLFESGVVGNGLWCFTVPEPGVMDRIEIIGTNGKIEFPTFEKASIRVIASKDEERYSIAWPEHVQQPLIQTVVAELQGNGTSPSTGESAARTNWVIDKIIRAFNVNSGSEQIDLFSG